MLKLKKIFFIYWDLKKLKWVQLINALGVSWKKQEKEKADLITPSIYDRHLIKNNQTFSPNKVSGRELYKMEIIKSNEKPTFKPYCNSFLYVVNLDMS